MTWTVDEGHALSRVLTPGKDGGSIVPGRLLRSENLQELSPADLTGLSTTSA